MFLEKTRVLVEKIIYFLGENDITLIDPGPNIPEHIENIYSEIKNDIIRHNTNNKISSTFTFINSDLTHFK